MMPSQFHKTIPLTEFMAEQLCSCSFQQIYPLLHPDIVWIGPSEREYLIGCDHVLSYFLQMSKPPYYRLTSQKYQLFSLSGQTCIVTGYYIADLIQGDGSLLSVKHYVTFVWQMFARSFHARHIHITNPFKSQKPMAASSLLLFRGKNGDNYLLSPNDIMYIEADNIYCKFYTKEQCTDICQSMNQIEQIMPKHFMRIHRSFIVNKNYVEKLSRYIITLINGISLPIPEKKYMQIKRALEINPDD